MIQLGWQGIVNMVVTIGLLLTAWRLAMSTKKHSKKEPEWLSKKPRMSKEEYDELVRNMWSPEHVKILAQTALYYADAETYSLEEDKQ